MTKQPTNTRFLIVDRRSGLPTIRLAGAGKSRRACRPGRIDILGAYDPVPDFSCEMAMDRILGAERERREAWWGPTHTVGAAP